MTIKDIDAKLFEISDDLDTYATTVDFTDYREFILGSDLGYIYDSSFNVNGIYRFEICVEDITMNVVDWMELFADEWGKAEIAWAPGLKKFRILQHKNLHEWIPIYIGKHKQVGKRVHQHLHQKLSAETFGMKLLGRTNLYGRRFRVSWIPLHITHYNFLAPAIEERLRNRFNPITGKQ